MAVRRKFGEDAQGRENKWEQDVIRSIQYLRDVKRQSWKAIARELTTTWGSTPRGKATWSPQTVKLLYARPRPLPPEDRSRFAKRTTLVKKWSLGDQLVGSRFAPLGKATGETIRDVNRTRSIWDRPFAKDLKWLGRKRQKAEPKRASGRAKRREKLRAAERAEERMRWYVPSTMIESLCLAGGCRYFESGDVSSSAVRAGRTIVGSEACPSCGLPDGLQRLSDGLAVCLGRDHGKVKGVSEIRD